MAVAATTDAEVHAATLVVLHASQHVLLLATHVSQHVLLLVTHVLQLVLHHATAVHQQQLLQLSRHRLAKLFQLLHHQKSLRLTSHHDCRSRLRSEAVWLGCSDWLDKLDLIAGLIVSR